jgi:hypothetical protein
MPKTMIKTAYLTSDIKIVIDKFVTPKQPTKHSTFKFLRHSSTGTKINLPPPTPQTHTHKYVNAYMHHATAPSHTANFATTSTPS